MKKILVVFLVLAVSTGVFAQGDWSIGAGAEVTSRINLNPKVDPDDPSDKYVATAGASGYHLYDWYGATHGHLDIGYSLGILSAGISLHQIDNIGGNVTVDGGNYKFQVDSNLVDIMHGTVNFGRLWGYYKLLDNMVHLEAAYNSRDAFNPWTSDVTGTFGGSGGRGKDFHDLFKDGGNFTGFDHHNYLLGNITVANLEFGLVAPNLFINQYATADNQAVNGLNAGDILNGAWEQDWDAGFWVYKDNTGKVVYTSAVAASAAKPNNSTLPASVTDNFVGVGYWAGAGYVRLVDQVLKKMIFGVKFDLSPLELAAQLLMENYSLYFGMKYSIGPINAGLSFMGELSNPNTTHMKAGLSIGSDSGSFGWGVRGKLDSMKYKGTHASRANESETTISVEPNFFYMAIPTHLQFNLAAGFYFANGAKADGTKIPMETYWGIQPQLVWNFMGTGSGWGGTSGAYDSYYMINTGMIFRYRMYSGDKFSTNALDITFKFGM